MSIQNKLAALFRNFADQLGQIEDDEAPRPFATTGGRVLMEEMQRVKAQAYQQRMVESFPPRDKNGWMQTQPLRVTPIE